VLGIKILRPLWYLGSNPRAPATPAKMTENRARRGINKMLDAGREGYSMKKYAGSLKPSKGRIGYLIIKNSQR